MDFTGVINAEYISRIIASAASREARETGKDIETALLDSSAFLNRAAEGNRLPQPWNPDVPVTERVTGFRKMTTLGWELIWEMTSEIIDGTVSPPQLGNVREYVLVDARKDLAQYSGAVARHAARRAAMLSEQSTGESLA